MRPLGAAERPALQGAARLFRGRRSALLPGFARHGERQGRWRLRPRSLRGGPFDTLCAFAPARLSVRSRVRRSVLAFGGLTARCAIRRNCARAAVAVRGRARASSVPRLRSSLRARCITAPYFAMRRLARSAAYVRMAAALRAPADVMRRGFAAPRLERLRRPQKC